MEVIKHSSGAIIINDAYNANPESMRSAISTFHRLYTGRKKYLLLGDMLELGGMSRVLHERVAFFIRKYKFDKIFLYGENMYNSAYKVLCRSKYYKDRVFHFDNKEDLSKALRENLDGNVAILLKGSRALMLEEIVHKI
jgi:UDP-N-acetylmuramoyl-tripeptide--D-alanyl-D-alanine ligase